VKIPPLRFFCTAIVSILILQGCAQVKPPTGGPEDKSPPKAVEVMPADSSVNVPIDTPIRIRFDEYIKGSAGNIALSPPVEKLDVKFRHRGIDISHSGLEPNTTYRVVISTAFGDLRGNTLRNAFSFAFSTGPRLDTLEIRGKVYNADFELADGIRIHAYSSEKATFNLRKTRPDAITWSGKGGEFSLQNLPDKEFIIIGIRDDNKDGFLSNNESVAFAPKAINAGTNIGWSMVIFAPDSTPPEIISVSTEDAYILKIRFSEPINFDELIIKASPPIGGFKPFIYQSEPKLLGILAETPLPIGKLELEISGVSDRTGNVGSYIQNIEIKAIEPDSILPRVSVNKKMRIFPTDSLIVRFDKPVRAGIVLVQDSLGRQIRGDSVLRDPFTIVFIPAEKWPNREDITWHIEDVIALDGSKVTDTTMFALSFESPESYGNLFVTTEPLCEELIVRAIMLGEEKSQTDLVKKPSGFESEGLPAGQYLIYMFCDSDGDSQWSPGDLSPFEFPEPIFIYPDTVVIRGFWTTEVNVSVR